MMHSKIPQGGDARIFNLKAYDNPWTIIIAKNAEAASPANLIKSSQITAICTHDEGVTWPAARARSLAVAALEQDGVMALSVVTLADALACKARLEGASR